MLYDVKGSDALTRTGDFVLLGRWPRMWEFVNCCRCVNVCEIGISVVYLVELCQDLCLGLL